MNPSNQTNGTSVVGDSRLEEIRNQPIHWDFAKFAIEEAANMIVLWGSELAQKPCLNPLHQPTTISNAPDCTLLVTLTAGQLRELVRDEVQRAGMPRQEAERLLTAEEAAEMLSMSTDWLYRHAKKLPFTRKLGPKALRFSYQGIVKWLQTRQLH